MGCLSEILSGCFGLCSCIYVLAHRSELRELINVHYGLLKISFQCAHRHRMFEHRRLTPQNFFSHIQEENKGKVTEDSFLIPCLKQKQKATQYRTEQGANYFTSCAPRLHGWVGDV